MGIQYKNMLPSSSIAERFVNCPYSFVLTRDLREQDLLPPPTQAAITGSRVHAAVASEIPIEQLSQDELEMFKAIVEQLKDFFGNILHCPWYYDWIVNKHASVVFEHRFYLFDEHLERVFASKPDLVVLDHESSTCVIVEFKTGAVEVEQPLYNWQLRTQAVAVHENSDYGFERYVLLVIAPKVSDRAVYTIVGANEIEQWSSQLWNAINAVQYSRHLTPIPGKWCVYCPGVAVCSSSYNMIGFINAKPDVLKVVYDKDTIVESLAAKWSELSPVQKLTRYQILEIASKAYMTIKKMLLTEIKTRFNEYKDYITYREQSPRRKIEVDKNYDVLNALGLTPDDVVKTSEFSLSSLAAAWYQKRYGKPMKSTLPERDKREFDAIIEPFVTYQNVEPNISVDIDKIKQATTINELVNNNSSGETQTPTQG